MCLAVPMKLVEVNDANRGVSELNGTRYDVDLSLVPDAAVGDYLIVHAGFAIETLDAAEADERLKLFDGMAAVWAEQDASK
ncbi:MAG: HypC/HybG/HupF family hydrogenase formation chaperone [Deltaproteobacteria bacterium]|nr:HypC/HybG/HupF family hydrogenase formation chaperone [Deltaproteobacteria bacterium]